MSIKMVEQAIKSCTNCPLRTKPVPGRGNPNARLMAVGQGPGWEEEKYGKCWVGQAGEFLMATFARLGIIDPYLTNWVKRYTGKGVGGDKPPTAPQIAACGGHLHDEVAAVDPELILAVGAISMRAFGIAGGIRINAGKVFYTDDWGAVMPILHPAGLMRNLSDTPLFVTQMAAVRTFLDGTGANPPPHTEA